MFFGLLPNLKEWFINGWTGSSWFWVLPCCSATRGRPPSLKWCSSACTTVTISKLLWWADKPIHPHLVQSQCNQFIVNNILPLRFNVAICSCSDCKCWAGWPQSTESLQVSNHPKKQYVVPLPFRKRLTVISQVKCVRENVLFKDYLDIWIKCSNKNHIWREHSLTVISWLKQWIYKVVWLEQLFLNLWHNLQIKTPLFWEYALRHQSKII